MILVGAIGVVYYLKHDQGNYNPQDAATKELAEKMVTVSVAIAMHDLDGYSTLNAEDFVIKSITVPEGSAETKFDIGDVNPEHWALRNAVTANSYIPPSSLVKSGSDEYLSMLVRPGHVIYPLELDPEDNYILKNVKTGSAIDIYLSYSVKIGDDGKHQIISPGVNIKKSRLKPLMYNKQILAIREVNVSDKKENLREELRSQLILDITDNELKVLKNLEGKSRIMVFPSTSQGLQVGNPHQNEAWPVSSERIVIEGESSGISTDVNELRGDIK